MKKYTKLLPIATFGFLVLSIAPAVSAYGLEQWQTAFSGTCSNLALCGAVVGLPGVPVRFGFWGWCAFGGSDGGSAVGTTGTTADCQITTYFTSGGPTNPFHASFDISGWTIATGSAFLPSGVQGFFLTSGTVEVTGPGATLLGIPTGVVLPLSAACGPVALTPGTPCDTGIPAIPGHFGTHPFPGFEINIQVNKLP